MSEGAPFVLSHICVSTYYDGQGFWLCQKRLSQGRFQHWPKADAAGSVRLDPHQLHLLLWNGNPAKAGTAPLWRPVTPGGPR